MTHTFRVFLLLAIRVCNIQSFFVRATNTSVKFSFLSRVSLTDIFALQVQIFRYYSGCALLAHRLIVGVCGVVVDAAITFY